MRCSSKLFSHLFYDSFSRHSDIPLSIFPAIVSLFVAILFLGFGKFIQESIRATDLTHYKNWDAMCPSSENMFRQSAISRNTTSNQLRQCLRFEIAPSDDTPLKAIGPNRTVGSVYLV
jgi:hypothetical protein